MRSLDVLGIGLLLLIANLVLCAVFAPAFSFGNGSPGLRLRKTLRILTLALVQIGAWAWMFHEGGASPTPEAAAEEALRLFTFMGRSTEGLEGPWAALVPFVSLNGLLFLPISLISGFTTELKVVTAAPELRPVESPRSVVAVVKTVAPINGPLVEDYEETQAAFEEELLPPLLPVQKAAKASEPVSEARTGAAVVPVQEAPQVQRRAVAEQSQSARAAVPAASAAGTAPAPASQHQGQQGPRRGEPFRGSLPPIQLHPQPQAEVELPTFSPDRPMERIPPTPPPIRFT